jgi:hypothetical protein
LNGSLEVEHGLSKATTSTFETFYFHVGHDLRQTNAELNLYESLGQASSADAGQTFGDHSCGCFRPMACYSHGNQRLVILCLMEDILQLSFERVVPICRVAFTRKRFSSGKRR